MSEVFVKTHVEEWSFNHLSQLLNLLLTTTNITVGHIRLLLHLQDSKWTKVLSNDRLLTKLLKPDSDSPPASW